MKLHRDIGVTQATAWFMLHRIRQAWFDTDDDGSFNGPVEVDETYFGGKRQNMSRSKRKALTGRGPVGKTAVVGAKDRATNQVSAKVVTSTDSETLQGFVKDNADPDATIYTDEATAYESLPFDHETVKHSVGEYVKGQAHINRVESFWATLKRAHKGTFHKISPKHPKPLRPRVRWQAQYPRSRDACADDDSCRSSCRQAANAQRPHRG